MPSLSTEGLVLYRRDFGEADRVITILTKHLGKISVVAKGVRRISSRRAGSVELLNQVNIHIYKSKGYTLTEAESIHTFPNIKSNLPMTSAGMHVAELLNKLLAEGVAMDGIYDFATEMLQVFEKEPRQIYLRAFEIKLLKKLGFWGSDNLTNVDERLLEIILKLENSNWVQIKEMRLDATHALALENFLRYYIEEVLESRLVSGRVMDKLRIKI
jgi:hypothetical protein